MSPFTTAMRAVLRREWRRIAERRTLHLLSVALPIVLFLFLASIYTAGVVRELPVAVCDRDHSELSRLIVRSIDATASFRIMETPETPDAITGSFRAGRIQAAFLLPAGLERGIKRGTGGTVTVFCNGSNLIIENTTLKDASTLLKTVSGGILLKKLRSAGAGEETAMAVVNPIRVQTQAMYNPTYNYLNYLVPGLLPVTLQMIIMVAAVLVISSEFTHGTFGELVETSQRNVWALFLGKSLPHLMLHAATMLGLIGLIYPLTGIPLPVHTGPTLGLFLLFITASLLVGIMFSTLFHDQQFATELALFFNTPAFLFSGYIFPLWAVPPLHRWFAQVMPFTHFLSGSLKIDRMQAPWPAALTEAGILLGFILVSAAASLLMLRHHVAVELRTREGS